MKRLRTDRAVVQLIMIWIAWAVMLRCYQHVVVSRFDLARPDPVLPWTAEYTQDNVLNGDPAPRTSPYLDFYRDIGVAWDSGYYLSIATRGYDDPDMSVVQAPTGQRVTLNYAFLPLYPLLIRLLMLLLQPLRLSASSTPIYAGIFISIVGTLAGMFALYALSRSDAANDGSDTRAPFYMLIFPTGFFLAQVYTEGLFVGLAFSCLALIQRKQWFWVALLGALATLTRAVGIGLALSLAVALLAELRTDWTQRRRISLKRTSMLLLVAAPVAVFLIWRSSPWGRGFTIVEEYAFDRHPLALRESWNAWRGVVLELGSGNRMRDVYYGLEFAALGLALVACLGTLRQHLPVALFGLFVLLVSVTSATPQSMIRYVLSVPSIYLFLSRLGRNNAFDRIWTLGSVLLMGTLLTLFTFDMWVG